MNKHFYKYHGLGNDYLVIDPASCDVVLTSNNIRLICNRNLGVGSDGILYGPLMDDEGNIRVQIFNPDGSEAEKSGNGTRIFARYLLDQAYVKPPLFTILTLGGPVQVEVIDLPGSLLKLDMGKVSFESRLIPVAGADREVVNEPVEINGQEYLVTCATVGNPHCVIPLPEISKELAQEIGPVLETHPMFPNRINVQLMHITDRNNINIEIWERGAGYTLASGSSSCAAAASAYRLGLADRSICVHMPGGTLEIEICEDDHVLMTGPVAGVASGNFCEDLLRLME